jgi:hypothetical protein
VIYRLELQVRLPVNDGPSCHVHTVTWYGHRHFHWGTRGKANQGVPPHGCALLRRSCLSSIFWLEMLSLGLSAGQKRYRPWPILIAFDCVRTKARTGLETNILQSLIVSGSFYLGGHSTTMEIRDLPLECLGLVLDKLYIKVDM